MAQAAAAAAVAVLVVHVGGRGVSAHRAGVGVTQRAAIGRAGGEGALVLGMARAVQAMDGVNVRESGRVLLVRRVPVAELQEGRFGGIRAIQTVGHKTHRHHWLIRDSANPSL